MTRLFTNEEYQLHERAATYPLAEDDAPPFDYPEVDVKIDEDGRLGGDGAKLVEAAPALYEALDRIVNSYDDGVFRRELIEDARAALAKARP